MNRERSLGALRELKAEASAPAVMAGGEALTAWKGKLRAVLAGSIGKEDHLVESFDGVRYHLSVMSTSTPRSDFDKARHAGIRTACGIIDAAIYQLEVLSGDDEPIDQRAFDPELWTFVKDLVDAEDWGKVASQTAIFVESHVRDWAGDPKDKAGDSLIGKTLYLAVFADDSDWRLGARAGEREGWRFLGMGFAQALSNVDRHRVQKRADARRYAIGVLGLGSLLLTQMRHEHPDLIPRPGS